MTSEVISPPAAPEPTNLNDSNRSDNSVQAKLIIREGMLRVEQVSAEVKSSDPGEDVNQLTQDLDQVKIGPADQVKLDTSTISTASETQTSPEKPDLVKAMGGFEECKTWLLSYIVSSNQYCRGENDIFNKIKREFSIFYDKEEIVQQLRSFASKISLLELDEEGNDKLYRTCNAVRYLVDSCITLHFFMKGSGGIDRIIKDNHKTWYEDESWDELGISYECYQKMLKGKVYKAMNGAIASKYSNWPGVKEFAQKYTYSNHNHQVKFTELYRLMKKDFAAPHDIVKHLKMEEVLTYCVATVPGLNIVGTMEEEKKVTTDPDVLKLVRKVKHLQQSNVKNISKEFSSFFPYDKDWTSYHMTYQKLNQYFRNIFNPTYNRRRSKPTFQEEPKTELHSVVLDSSHKQRHSYPAVAINLPNEKKSDNSRHNYERNEGARARSNSNVEREENTTVYLNTDKRSVVTVVGLPGTGKTTTLSTLLARSHTKHSPSTVLILSSNCCTTNKLLKYTSGTVLRTCPAKQTRGSKSGLGHKKHYSPTQKLVDSKDKKRKHVSDSPSKDDDSSYMDSSDSFIVHDEVGSDEIRSDEYESVDTPAETAETAGNDPKVLIEVLEEGEIKEEIPTDRPENPEEPTEPEKEKPQEPSEDEKNTADAPKKDSTKSDKTKKPKYSVEKEVEDEYKKVELPFKPYNDITEVLNPDSEGRITVVHFPDADTMEPEIVCSVLEEFRTIPSKHPKILIVDIDMNNTNYTCPIYTMEELVQEHRDNNMSIWVATRNPLSFSTDCQNMLDYTTLAILHQYTSKNWYNELSVHLPLTSATYQLCQGLAPGQSVMVAPGAHMTHPIHSSSYCYPCNIITPGPINS